MISIGRLLAILPFAAVTPASAAQCALERATYLNAARASFFNSYYFSNLKDPDRCMDLQSAILHQQELVVWFEACDPGNASEARLELSRLTSLTADPANCTP